MPNHHRTSRSAVLLSGAFRGAQHHDPHWSPDGRWLMFTGAVAGAIQFDLMVIPVSGGEAKSWVTGDHDERGGSWSPTD